MEGGKQDPRAQEEEGKGLGLALKEKRKKVTHLLADIEAHMGGEIMTKGEKGKVGQILLKHKEEGDSQVSAQSGETEVKMMKSAMKTQDHGV